MPASINSIRASTIIPRICDFSRSMFDLRFEIRDPSDSFLISNPKSRIGSVCFLNFHALIIGFEYFFVTVARPGHAEGSDLAQTDAVAPPASVK